MKRGKCFSRMAHKRNLLPYLENLSSNELFQYIDEITDTQAVDSDEGGDSDGEEDRPSTSALVLSTSTTKVRNETPKPSTSTEARMDWDSDDSVVDPTYDPDDSPLKKFPLRMANMSSGSETEKEDEIEERMDYTWSKSTTSMAQKFRQKS